MRVARAGTMRVATAGTASASRTADPVRAVPERAAMSAAVWPVKTAAATAVRMLRPSALPIWWTVFTRPEAAPASAGATPSTPLEVSGASVRPWPAPISTMGSATPVG